MKPIGLKVTFLRQLSVIGERVRHHFQYIFIFLPIRLLPRKDIQVVVGHGCPSLDRKVVNSGKRLRAHVGINEGNVCAKQGSTDFYLSPSLFHNFLFAYPNLTISSLIK